MLFINNQSLLIWNARDRVYTLPGIDYRIYGFGGGQCLRCVLAVLAILHILIGIKWSH